MTGMTLKQYHVHHFLKLCDAYGEASKRMDTPEGKSDFINLSLAIHAAKGQVPKKYWPLANKALKTAKEGK